MKKYLLLLILLGSFVYAKVNTVVSILPQKTFVEAIGGEKVDVALMVKPGNSPHSYEPKPSQMKQISKADIYFSIGVEFEEVWLSKFANQNEKMQIVDISKGIIKLEMKEHHHEDEEHEEHHAHENEKQHEHDNHDEHEGDAKHEHEEEHQHDGLDPHVWTSPKNVKIIAKNILDSLVKADKKNKEYYEQNYNKFMKHVNKIDKKISSLLSVVEKDSKFMVFHPSWGYFAKEYGLVQFAIEVEGKSPKPKQIAYIIDEAKEEGVKAIFTAPEFSDNVAKQIANELNIKVIKVSPLDKNWGENLIGLAKAIAGK